MSNNYFFLLKIESTFNIDLNELEKKYIELNRQLHSDVSGGGFQDIMNVNKAYEVLKSPLKRAEHLLELCNVEEYSGDVSHEMLNESMEIREYLLDCDNIDSASRMINRKIEDCIKALTGLFAKKNFKEAVTQVLRLRYLYKSHEEVKKNAANTNF